jgi:hypothetical protein
MLMGGAEGTRKNHMLRAPREGFAGAERTVTSHNKRPQRVCAYLQGGGHDEAALRQLIDYRHGGRPDAIDDQLFRD